MDGAVIRPVVQESISGVGYEFEDRAHELAFGFDPAPEPLFNDLLFLHNYCYNNPFKNL